MHDSSPSAGLDLRLTYTLIYQVNLRTYFANKYIIFMVCFLSPDFSYHWSRLWLLLQETWRSLRKLEEAWRSLKTLAATDSSCSGWFKLRPIDYLQNFDPDAPWYPHHLDLSRQMVNQKTRERTRRAGAAANLFMWMSHFFTVGLENKQNYQVFLKKISK